MTLPSRNGYKYTLLLHSRFGTPDMQLSSRKPLRAVILTVMKRQLARLDLFDTEPNTKAAMFCLANRPEEEEAA